jgi:ribosomal protein S18 acetylase RimI-like enzyme
MIEAVPDTLKLRPFAPKHLDGAMELFTAEEWRTYTADRECTCRWLTAAGATTLVALEGSEVVALVQLQSDGEIQAHLSALVVAERWRRQGLARRLLREALRRAGGLRIDLITRSERFYRGLGARPTPGCRLTREDLELAERADTTNALPEAGGGIRNG